MKWRIAMTKNTGRNHKGDGPAFPHDEVDRLLVHGELIDTGAGACHLHFPTYRQLAKKYNVSHSLIGKFAKRHNCAMRRQQAEKRVKEMADMKLSELRADDLAVTRDDSVRIIDRFLLQFESALKEDRVRCDNPTDYNTMIRLKSFLLGDADSRQELLGGITLETIQERYKVLQDEFTESSESMRGQANLKVVDEAPESEEETIESGETSEQAE